jgi:hypothetical protein
MKSGRSRLSLPLDQIANLRGATLSTTMRQTSAGPLFCLLKPRYHDRATANQAQQFATMHSRVSLSLLKDQDVGIKPHSVEASRRFSPIRF